jgi:hypothetical protein
MLPLLVAILLQTRFAAPDADLATAALASPRPRECRGAAGDTLWSRLRGAEAERYCELLARGYARLPNTPGEALSAAQAAQALAGPVPAVFVLTGRAQLRLGQPALAFEQFAQAESRDAQAFVDPKALHDYARAASLAGKSASSVRLYRLLASRIALLDDACEAAFVQIEAAAHVLAYTPNGTDEALGYLAQARRQALGLSAWIEALRSLAVQRSGRAEPRVAQPTTPRTAAFDAGSAGSSGSSGSAEAPLLPPSVLEALRSALPPPAARKAKSR